MIAIALDRQPGWTFLSEGSVLPMYRTVTDPVRVETFLPRKYVTAMID